MRKLVVLILVAALVGVIISKTRSSNVAAESADGEAAPAVASGDVEPESAAGADPTTLPAAEPGGAGLERAEPPRVAASVPVARSAEPGRSPSAPQPLLMSSRAPVPAAEAAATLVSVAEPARLDREVAAQIEHAAGLLRAGRRLEARAMLSRLYLRSRGAVAARLRELLDRVNADLVFNPRCLEGAQIHVVESGENLTNIARKYGVCWPMLKRLNGMQSDRLKIGQKLKVIVGRTSAVAVKSEFRLALLMDGVYVREYPVGIGKEDLTPAGELVVDSKVVRAPWTKPGGGIITYGEEGYLLGERWIGFRNEPGAHGLGIHGTNDEASIGTKCSNGCLRMKNSDVIELYDFLQPGSLVTICE